MKLDLVIKDCTLPGLNGRYDVGVREGVIQEIGRELSGEVEYRADGRLLVPGMGDMHVHLDSALTLGKPRFNQSGTLLEGIEIWGEYKRTMTKEDVKRRAIRAVEWMLVQGVTMIRTHADVTDHSLTGLRALLELKEELKGFVDLQVTAFPQDGILTDKVNVELLEKAVEMGADNVGMIPHNEMTREDGVRSISIAFELAQKYDRGVDGHVDETDDPNSRFLEVVAAETIRRRMTGKVSAGHVTAMHSYNGAYADKLIRLLRRAGVNVVVNPAVNLHLQGRYDTYPKRRGLARVRELLAAGVNVALGNDCVMDPWYPLGRGDILQSLFLAMHGAHLTSYQDVVGALGLVTYNAAKVFGLKKYGIEKGNPADLVLFDARHPLEVVRDQPTRMLVVKGGKVVARGEPERYELLAPERKEISFSPSFP
ncbi:amidohydrolase [Sulfodiicoccus acidiphilus]|uniref:Amidohydrolase n=1 Tax=Sulfodiicoccus acidiphilus TaxID=1670455 RepID=A0A348B6C9_9CREN|nr:cytosine deaminase [Sulfodiicoccus acidiphilus]BBD73731.1 amidohydrolase [Sulfodiicoccus acidiphilus]GGT97936.1 amidohydrolase [Sulfodiicoccus acidiphilus]